MNIFHPEKISGSKIYFTEADPLLHTQESLGYETIENKLKTWLLLSDYVVISGTHIMSSPEMHKIITNNPRLVKDGVVVPYIRENISTFSEYLLTKNDEDDTSFKVSKKDFNQKSAAEFLDEDVSTAILWKPDNAIKLYQQSLVQELLDRGSSLRKKMVGVAKNNIHQLAEDISNLNFVSRGNIDNLAKKYLRERHQILIRHSNFLYYLWGATHLDCEPILHPATYNIGIDKLKSTIDKLFENQRIDKETSLRNDEPTVLQRVLNDYGVINNAITKISFNSILDLRKEKESCRFRKKWMRLVREAKTRNVQNLSQDNLLSEELNGLYELVSHEVGKEIHFARKLKKINTALSVGSFVTSGLAGAFLSEIGGIVGGIASLAGVDPLVSAVQSKIGGLEISLFCSRIQELSSNHSA